MTYTLESKYRQVRVYNLPHHLCCTEGACTCVASQYRTFAKHPSTGEILPKILDRSLAGSLTLRSKQKVSGVAEAVLACPELAADIASGMVKATPDGDE